MDSLKLLVVGVASLVAGYLGYKLTGGLIGIPIGVMVVAYAGFKLLAGEFVHATLAVCVGAFAMFHFMVNGVPEAPKLTLPQASQGMGASGGTELAARLPAGGASDAALMPKEDAVGMERQGASAAPGTAAALPEMKVGKVFKDCADCPELVVLPAGKFTMGSSASATGPDADGTASPAHNVIVRSFAMGQDAVTRGQFGRFVKATGYQTDAERLGGCFALSSDNWEFKAQLNWRKPGFVQADNHPAVCVTWNDAQAYIQWLATSTRQKYRLPSEAEREYATRAGSIDAYWWGDNITMDQANFHGDATDPKAASKAVWRKATLPIKQFETNPFGLYNVHGNAWEWVQDCQHDNYKGAPVDGSAWTANCTGTRRGVRGGGWVSPAAGLRSAQRTWFEPDLPSFAGGFRVARSL